MNSKLFSLVSGDYLRGLYLTILAAVLTSVYQAITNGGAVDWKVVGTVALTSGIAYLLKNLSTDQNGRVFGKFPL